MSPSHPFTTFAFPEPLRIAHISSAKLLKDRHRAATDLRRLVLVQNILIAVYTVFGGQFQYLGASVAAANSAPAGGGGGQTALEGWHEVRVEEGTEGEGWVAAEVEDAGDEDSDSGSSEEDGLTDSDSESGDEEYVKVQVPGVGVANRWMGRAKAAAGGGVQDRSSGGKGGVGAGGGGEGPRRIRVTPTPPPLPPASSAMSYAVLRSSPLASAEVPSGKGLASTGGNGRSETDSAETESQPEDDGDGATRDSGYSSGEGEDDGNGRAGKAKNQTPETAPSSEAKPGGDKVKKTTTNELKRKWRNSIAPAPKSDYADLDDEDVPLIHCASQLGAMRSLPNWTGSSTGSDTSPSSTNVSTVSGDGKPAKFMAVETTSISSSKSPAVTKIKPPPVTITKSYLSRDSSTPSTPTTPTSPAESTVSGTSVTLPRQPSRVRSLRQKASFEMLRTLFKGQKRRQ
ncbi:hypothetical protein HK104_004109, partial [Borealophlyctis nickersoniae]